MGGRPKSRMVSGEGRRGTGSGREDSYSLTDKISLQFGLVGVLDGRKYRPTAVVCFEGGYRRDRYSIMMRLTLARYLSRHWISAVG